MAGKFAANQVIDAIRLSKGMVTQAAHHLSCEPNNPGLRQTLSSRPKSSARLNSVKGRWNDEARCTSSGCGAIFILSA